MSFRSGLVGVLCLSALVVACGGSDDEGDAGAEQVMISAAAENHCNRVCDESFACVTDQGFCLSECRENAAWAEEHCENTYGELVDCWATVPLSEYSCLDIQASPPIAACDGQYRSWDTCVEPYK